MSAVGETLLADAIETMVEKVYNAFKDYFVEIEETVERGGDGTEYILVKSSTRKAFIILSLLKNAMNDSRLDANNIHDLHILRRQIASAAKSANEKLRALAIWKAQNNIIERSKADKIKTTMSSLLSGSQSREALKVSRDVSEVLHELELLVQEAEEILKLL